MALQVGKNYAEHIKELKGLLDMDGEVPQVWGAGGAHAASAANCLQRAACLLGVEQTRAKSSWLQDIPCPTCCVHRHCFIAAG